MTTDELYMQRCLQLAQQGAGRVSTNPMVGCVVVHNGQVVGEGYHRRYGEAHAEVNAINAVADKSILPGCTLYVTLEPCAHHGKTPPCANLIVEHRLKRVVVGTVDTFSLVAGKGIERLRNAGIEVTVGVLETECRYQNRRFFCYHENKRPYVILKWAQTANGYMGRPEHQPHLDKKISNPQTTMWVHRWRTEEDAILVGKNTALLDNPMLTTRHWQGKNPVRVLIDPQLKVPANYTIFNGEAITVVFNAVKQGQETTIRFEKIDFTANAKQQLLARLYALNIQSVLVEGGSKTLQGFIDKGLWDEARIIQSPQLWQSGVPAPQLYGNVVHSQSIGTDTVTFIHPE